MSLANRISDDMKEAMKTKNSATLSTLRLLRSAMKNKQIDVQHELSDEEILAVIKTSVKQLRDSIESFESGGRQDLAQSARGEVIVLEAYLPAQLTDEQLERMVKEAITQTGATSKQDMGKVMGAAVKAVSGGADGSRIKQIVEKFLPVIVLVGLTGVLVVHPAQAAIDILPVQLSQYSLFETLVRILRVLLLWFGVLAINMILHGGFLYMVSSMRDENHAKAWTKIATGFLTSLAIVFLYGIATIVIEVM
ncbi:GatB/YqeY domain-containing protein [Candidatus Uhrbacteria bacterium]|nr:GatB/YqeY domain-containing protein [Candidatus Uhrbacteria bacterium]